MARLPDVTTLGSRPTPRPSGGVAGYRPITGEETTIGETLMDVGTLFERDLDEINTLRAEDATNKLHERAIDLSMGEDGYARLKSGDAATHPFEKDYQDRLNAASKEIEATLSTPEQKLKYRLRASGIRTQFVKGMWAHKLAQSEIYDKDVYTSTIETSARVAAADPTNVDNAAAQALRASEAARIYSRRQGDDEKIAASRTIEAESAVHSAVIEAQLNAGQDQLAMRFFNGVKDRMTDKDRSDAERKLEISSTAGEALRGADEVWEQAGPQGPYDPARIFQMEQIVRDRWGDNPKVVNAIIGELRSRASAHAAEQAEITDAGKADALSLFNEGRSAAQVMQSPAYRNLAGDDQASLLTYMQNQEYTQQQRGRAEQAYQDKQLAINGRRVYWGLTGDKAYLASLSENAIMAMEPDIGLDAVGDLLTAKRKLDSPAKILEATLDADQFKTIASEVLPVFEDSDPHIQERLVRLRDTVEEAIAVEQSGGRKLTREQKGKIMQEIIDKDVMIDKSFRRDPSRPAATVLPDERGEVYTPIDQIPPDHVSKAIEYLRSIGVVGQGETDQEAKARHQRRIERAVGVRQVGGSEMDAIKILQGED